MIWDAIKRLWVATKPVAPPPTPVILEFPKIKMLSMTEVSDILDTGKSLNNSLIKEGCRICSIPYVGGGIIFVSKQETVEEEYELIKQQLGPQLSSTKDYLVAYGKINRPHPYLSYYTVIAIASNDMLDLKKAFKIQKLKAFL